MQVAYVTKGKCHSSLRSPTRKGKLFTVVKSFGPVEVLYTIKEAVKRTKLSDCLTSLDLSCIAAQLPILLPIQKVMLRLQKSAVATSNAHRYY